MTLSDLRTLFPDCTLTITSEEETLPAIPARGDRPGRPAWTRTITTAVLVGSEPHQRITLTHDPLYASCYIAEKPPKYDTSAESLEELLPVITLWMEKELPGLDTDLSFLSHYEGVTYEEQNGIRMAYIPFREDIYPKLNVQAGQNPRSPYILFYAGMDHEHYDTAAALDERLRGLFENRIAMVETPRQDYRIPREQVKDFFAGRKDRPARAKVYFYDPALDYTLDFTES